MLHLFISHKGTFSFFFVSRCGIEHMVVNIPKCCSLNVRTSQSKKLLFQGYIRKQSNLSEVARKWLQQIIGLFYEIIVLFINNIESFIVNLLNSMGYCHILQNNMTHFLKIPLFGWQKIVAKPISRENKTKPGLEYLKNVTVC